MKKETNQIDAMFWHRLLDVNVNRACEGLRVLEDLSKFVYQKENLAKDLRYLRHNIRKTFGGSIEWARMAVPDMGLEISRTSKSLDAKADFSQLWVANACRVSEALRVIEECTHGMGNTELAKKMEALRHRGYRLLILRERVPVSGLYPLIDGSGDVEAQLDAFRAASITWVQYRDKKSTSAHRYMKAVKLRALTDKHNMKLVINDDVTLAVACGADGVHLGQEDLPIEAARLIAPHLTIGLSTHSRAQVELATHLPIDYLAIGPVFPTTSKENPEFCEGVSLLSWARTQTSLPIVAIGGVNAQNIAAVKGYKVEAIAAIASFLDLNQLKACSDAWFN